MAPARLLALLICAAPAAGCGGGDDGSGGDAPPPDITLDAYASHDEAVEVQEQWESDDPEVGELCSKFFDSPNLVDDLKDSGSLPALRLSTDYPALSDVSRAELEAADACSKGTDLQRWEDDEFDQELEAEKQEAEAAEEAVREAAATVIDNPPGFDSCGFVHDKLAPLRAREIELLPLFERETARELESVPASVIPDDVDLDKVAEEFVFTCATTRPELAAEALRNPDTPTDELTDEPEP